MRIKKCRRCKTSIPRNARICPYCFKRQWTGTVIILLSMMVLLTGIGSYLKYWNKGDLDENLFLEEKMESENLIFEDKKVFEEGFGTMMKEDEIIENGNIEAEEFEKEQQEKERQERERIQKELGMRLADEKEREEKERLEKERKEKERLRQDQLAREQKKMERIRKEIEEREREIKEQVEQEKLRKEEINAGSAESQLPGTEEETGIEQEKEGNVMQEMVPTTVKEKDVAEDTIKVEQTDSTAQE